MSRRGTRLLGAGRLAIEVPAAWPVEVGSTRVTRSSIVLPMAVATTEAFWSPVDGAVSVEVHDVGPRSPRTRHREAGRAVHPGGLSDEDLIVSERQVIDRVGPDSYTRLELAAPSLGGAFDLSGPRADVRAIAATARLVPDGWTAVPNVLMGAERDSRFEGSEQPDEDQARILLQRAGLRLRGGGVVERTSYGDLSTNPAELLLIGTLPSGGSVVPAGSAVVARFVVPQVFSRG